MITEMLTLASMGLNIYKGIEENSAYQAQAATTRSYAQIQLGDSLKEAARTEEEGARFAQKQKMMYIGSGVEYGGSAVITVAQTKSWAAAEARAQRSRGQAMYQYGMKTASIQSGMGRAALIGGFAAAFGNANSYVGAKGMGGGVTTGAGSGPAGSMGGGGVSYQGMGNNFSGIPGFNLSY